MGRTSVVSKPLLLQVALIFVLLSGAMITTIPAPEHSIADAAVEHAVIPLGTENYVRIMTYNIRHGKGLDGRVDLNRIIEDIKHGDPDIVALQEVDRFHIRSRFADQVKILQNALNMDAFFSPSLYYYGVAEYGNAILSKYPLYNKKIELLPGIKETRSLLSAQVMIGEQEVTLFTTHLGVLDEERESQMSLILDRLHEAVGQAVFLGDFNMEHTHALLQNLPEAWEKASLIHDTGTFYLGDEIDHIFAGPFVEAIQAWTIKTKLLIILPVVAELKIMKQ